VNEQGKCDHVHDGVFKEVAGVQASRAKNILQSLCTANRQQPLHRTREQGKDPLKLLTTLIPIRLSAWAAQF